MGIKGLSKVIETNCPKAIQNRSFENYGASGHKIAISANIFLHKFMLASKSAKDPTETLKGLFFHAVGMIDTGIKPVYVFHGDPHLSKIGDNGTEKTQTNSDTAKKSGGPQELDRPNKVDNVHIESAKRLLNLMGIPIVQAPGKAEAQCAALTKSGEVFAVATEDMDTLLYGAKVMLRDFTVTSSKQASVREFDLDKVLEGFQFSIDEFIDLCILIGSDYCAKLPGIGEKKALGLIKKHRNIQEILNQNSKGKLNINVPNGFNYQHAQQVFKNPVIDETVEIDWGKPIDEEGIISYLCLEMGLNENSIRNGVTKLQDARKKFQGTLDSIYSKRKSTGIKDTDDSAVGGKKPKIEKNKQKREDDAGASRKKK